MLLDRDALIEDLADRAADAVDAQSLLDYFIEGQRAWLDDLPTEDLVTHAMGFGGFTEDMLLELYSIEED